MAETKNIKITSDEEEGYSKESQFSDSSASLDAEAIEEIEPDEDLEVEFEAKLESAKQEAKENYDRLLRVSAEFENYKKRTAREQTDLKKYANEALIKDLLSVVDNLERAIDSAANESKDISNFLEGVKMTHQEVLKILKKYHVNPIESVGNQFDPCYHQAVMQTDTSDYPANTIIQELQKGYLIHDRLLRPAMVVVSKSPDTVDKA